MNKVQSSNSLQQEDKVSRLEEVVDKVVGIHMAEHEDSTQPVEKVPEEPAKVEETTDHPSPTENNDTEENKQEDTEEQKTEQLVLNILPITILPV